MKKYILSIDAGTTGIRLLLIDKNLALIKEFYLELEQYYPKPGWVEHDPIELINKIRQLLSKVVEEYDIYSIASIGITNQRETIVMWDKNTGEPVHPAIVWQCRRTKEYCNTLNKKHKDSIFKKTGLYVDSYFSATKIQWLLKNVDSTKMLLRDGNLLVGTIDTWIIWNLTNKKNHMTDYTNASRTMLFNINTKIWDKYLLELFDIPLYILPKVKNSMDDFGNAEIDGFSIPIQGVSGDQQAALFGQGCITQGSSKCTYGTGLFYLFNTGKKRIDSTQGLLTTLASDAKGKPVYVIEGSVFIGGAIIQWIRDELELIQDASETEDIAMSINDTGGVYIVPAFVGLGAPYWNSDCKGIITGLTLGSNKKHIIRAALESIAYQVNDLLECIKKDIREPLTSLNVDGGATNNSFLLQFQSDISKIKILKPDNIESTALGAAILAGLKNGFWKNVDQIFKHNKIDKIYTPQMDDSKRKKIIDGWKASVNHIK